MIIYQDITLSWSTLSSDEWALFEARINTSTWATQLEEPWLQVNLPIVNYELDWQQVRYYLSEWNEWIDETAIKLKWEEFLWVKIIWTLQADGKSEFTWQEENISDLSKLEIRDEIRKEAYLLVKNMQSWEILNWVKYIEWDVKISWEISWYETLIVQDWNIIIEWDLNTNNNKLWIIVLKDNYNVNIDYNNKWNVYITPNVTYIDAIIYADWWLISSDYYWNPYTKDTIERTLSLQKQLLLEWSLFTRNTIGWGILAWWYYLLPGWEQSLDFDKAMIYDLNYIRIWNNWCKDDDFDWECDLYNNPFIIKYNSEIQTNPPIWFSN